METVLTLVRRTGFVGYVARITTAIKRRMAAPALWYANALDVTGETQIGLLISARDLFQLVLVRRIVRIVTGQAIAGYRSMHA